MAIDVIHGDARATGLPAAHFHTVITSPPYFGLREYGEDEREIGDEATPEEYVSEMVAVGREMRRVLRDDGTWWLNLGDSYASGEVGRHDYATGDKIGAAKQAAHGARKQRRLSTGVQPKSLLGIPWRVALALQGGGWILRAAVPWIKANPMPESVTDRPTVAHEHVFLLAKSPRYFWDADAVRMGVAASTISQHGALAFVRTGDAGASPDRNDYRGKAMGERHCGTNPNGRNLRTSDLFAAGLDQIEQTAAEIARARADGGMLLSPDGDPLAFMVNPVPNRLAHFAMWPPRLVAPMIKASTSEAGCCPTCGAPWERATGTPRGFRPSCSCPAAPAVPCRVLDPFGGSGTTAQVARALRRSCTLVEVQAKNLPIIDARLREHLDPAEMTPIKRPETDARQVPLFGEVG